MTVYVRPFSLIGSPIGFLSANNCVAASRPMTTTRRASSLSASLINRPCDTSMVLML